MILISLVNNAAAYIYVYVQYNEASEFVIAIALFLWSQAHGKKFSHTYFNNLVYLWICDAKEGTRSAEITTIRN